MQLRRLFRVVNGGTPSADAHNWGGEIVWLTPDDLGKAEQQRIGESARTLSEGGLKSARLVPPGSIVMSTRAPIGHMAIADCPLAFNQGCKGLVPSQPVDERFFYYQLMAKRSELASRGQGTTFPELSGANLASLHVTCPPLGQQRRIADFLDDAEETASTACQRGRRLGGLLAERLVSIRADAFQGLGPATRLRWYTRSILQGTSPQAEDREAEAGEWAVLKLSAVHRGRFRRSEHKALSERPPGPELVPRADDLLVTRANTPKLVGDCCVVGRDEKRLLLPDLIYRIRLDQNRMLPRFAMHFLLGPGRAQLEAAARGTSQSMVKLRGSDILDVRLPVPTLQEQVAVVEGLDAAFARAATAQDKIKALELRITERQQARISAAIAGDLDAVPTQDSAMAR